MAGSRGLLIFQVVFCCGSTILRAIGVPFRTAECNASGTKWFRRPNSSLDEMGTALDHIKDIGAFRLACAEMRGFTVVWKNGRSFLLTFAYAMLKSS